MKIEHLTIKEIELIESALLWYAANVPIPYEAQAALRRRRRRKRAYELGNSLQRSYYHTIDVDGTGNSVKIVESN